MLHTLKKMTCDLTAPSARRGIATLFSRTVPGVVLALGLFSPGSHAATYCSDGNWAGAASGYRVAAWFSGNIAGWACVTNPTTTDPTSFKIEWNITTYGFLHEGSQRDMNYLSLSSLGSPHWAYHNHTLTDGGSPSGGQYYTALYGWIYNPTIEFYIIDNWHGARPVPTTDAPRGQISSDGAIYDIYYTVVSGGWGQWWSLRRTPRTSGNINYGAHILKWRSLSTSTSKPLTGANTCLGRIGFGLEPKWGTASKGKIEYWKAQINK